MSTVTVRAKLLVTVSLVVMLVLGGAIGYAIADATRPGMPMRTMSGMDMDMDMDDMGEHMNDMWAHMDEMGMDMGSMMGPGFRGADVKRMPAMHGHD